MTWTKICSKEDLVPNAGVAALYKGEQIALFYQTRPHESVFAISNWDPVGKANVLSRGLITDVDGQFYVASPLLKQRYHLASGKCLDAPTPVTAWNAKISEGSVWVRAN